MAGCRHVTDEAVESVVQMCPNITILLFHSCPNLTGNAIDKLYAYYSTSANDPSHYE